MDESWKIRSQRMRSFRLPEVLCDAVGDFSEACTTRRMSEVPVTFSDILSYLLVS